MQSAKHVLGIEGGGTKTEWVFVESAKQEETVRSQGVLPASNLKLSSDLELTHLFEVLPREPTHVGAFLAGCGT